MKLYISTTFVTDDSPLYKALDLCKGSDIQTVEIGSNHCYESNYNYLLDYEFHYLVYNYFPMKKK